MRKNNEWIKISVFLFDSFWRNLPKLYMNNFSKNLWKLKKGHTQANYDEAIQIFYFLLFISPFNGFLFKGSCSSKSILFIYSYFYRGKYCTTFFFLLKTISEGISSTHIIIPYIMIIYFQCQAQEITHDQCVNLSVVHIRSIWTSGWLWQIYLLLQWVSFAMVFLRINLKSQSLLVFHIRAQLFSVHSFPFFFFFCSLQTVQSQKQNKNQSLNKLQNNSSLSH